MRNGRGGYRGGRGKGGVVSNISGRSSINVIGSNVEMNYKEK